MAGIERAHDGGGADALATVTKRATDAVGRRFLANEATVLGRLSHPGVIRLVAHTETDRHGQLLTELVPGSTLADIDLDSPAALAAVGAAAAAVVADLHALGIAHGSLAPDHLIVSGGRVVLCSFGRAAEATAAAMDRDVADLVVALTETTRRLPEPGSRVERRRRRALDDLLVGAASRSLTASQLGAACAALAGANGAGGTRGPVAGAAHTTSTGDAQDDASAAPASVAARPDPAIVGPRRPAPDTAARPWRERVARGGALGGDAGADGAATAPWHRRRNMVAGAAAGLVVVAAWALLTTDRHATTAAPSQLPVAAPPAAPTPSPAATPMPTPSPSPPQHGEAPRVVVVGNLVAVDDAWFEVGRSDDIVRIGDWDCDGSLSAAVLRPTSGEIFVFDEWVEGNGVRRVEALTVIPGAADLAPVASATCDTLVVVDRTGREAVVEVTS
ncbi:MAG: hypothetical protein ACE367_13175 [Acidimicrobiales bacterium]